VDVTRRDRARVRERLAARDLTLLHRQGDRSAAELPDGRFKTQPRPRRVLLEKEQERAPGERVDHIAAPPRRFQIGGPAANGGVLRRVEVGQGEKIALHSSASRRCANSSCRRGVVLALSAARAARCSSAAICSFTCCGPVPPAFRLRATDARGSAARSTSSSKPGSISRASASVARESGSCCSWQRRTSFPTIWYAVRNGTPFCASASATS